MVEQIRPGSVAYDIGANYGIHALLMSRLVQGHGHVYAFEPVPDILSQLEQNLTLNRFQNATCLRIAVDDRRGTANFVMGHHGGAGHLEAVAIGGHGATSVTTVSLDAFVYESGHRAPDFIKIDVEGAESRVLNGAQRVLRTSRPTLLVDLHNPEQDAAVGQILSELDYQAYRTADGTPVKSMRSGWPDPDGVWGQIVAFARKRSPS